MQALPAVLMACKADPPSELPGLSSSKRRKGNWAVVSAVHLVSLAWSLDPLF